MDNQQVMTKKEKMPSTGIKGSFDKMIIRMINIILDYLNKELYNVKYMANIK